MIIGATKEEVKFISGQIRVDFKRRYGDGKELRERLYEMQKCRCCLCDDGGYDDSNYIQGCDGVFCQIEHMMPLREWAEFYVTSGQSVEEIVSQANDLKNLRLSHINCGSRKNDRYLDELPDDFFETLEHPVLAPAEIQRRKEKMSETRRPGGKIGGKITASKWTHEHQVSAARIGGDHNYRLHPEQYIEMGRKGGLISGPKNVQSGQLKRIHELPQSKAAYCENGRLAGLKAVESGFIQALGRAYGPSNGRKAAETGQLASVRTPESCAKGGRIGGKIGGKIAASKWTREHQVSAARKNAAKHFTTEHQKAAGRISGHVRCHVNRNIVNPNCPLCVPSLRQAA